MLSLVALYIHLLRRFWWLLLEDLGGNLDYLYYQVLLSVNHEAKF